MSIRKLPKGLRAGLQACVICGVSLSLEKATAGLLDSNGCQAFACISHLSEVELLIRGWADFMAEERTKYDQRRREEGILPYEERDRCMI